MVALLVNEKLAFELPWNACLEVARELIAAARKAESFKDADRLVDEQALIQRAGFPVGVTNNRHLQKAAMNEAAWGKYRRYLPGGLPSQTVVGVPAVVSFPPKEPSDG